MFDSNVNYCFWWSLLENDRMLKQLLEQEPVENVPIATFGPAPTSQQGGKEPFCVGSLLQVLWLFLARST